MAGLPYRALTEIVYAILGCSRVAPAPLVHKFGGGLCPRKKTKEDPAQQLEAFKRLAREIGAGADNKGDEVMKRLAKQERKTANKRKPR